MCACLSGHRGPADGDFRAARVRISLAPPSDGHPAPALVFIQSAAGDPWVARASVTMDESAVNLGYRTSPDPLSHSGSRAWGASVSSTVAIPTTRLLCLPPCPRGAHSVFLPLRRGTLGTGVLQAFALLPGFCSSATAFMPSGPELGVTVFWKVLVGLSCQSILSPPQGPAPARQAWSLLWIPGGAGTGRSPTAALGCLAGVGARDGNEARGCSTGPLGLLGQSGHVVTAAAER